jgi:septal ring factor EnvC (AmiA/AmiB activator)
MRRALILIPAFFVLGSAAYAAAATEGGSLADRYQRALRELEANRLNESQTKAERDRLASEAQNLQARLIANAAKVQELEAAYESSQEELAGLSAKERALLADLDRDRDRVAHLLAVLQRLYSDRPPALALRPDDSLAAARGTMQLGVMLPPVYEQVAELDRSLKTLTATQQALKTKAAEAQREAAELTSSRAELDQLLQLRNRETAAADTRLTEVRTVTESVAHETQTLKTLIDRIATLRAGSGANRGMTVVTARNSSGGTLQRGSLRVPVIGSAEPGDPAGPGRTPGVNSPQGLWFSARSQAQAVAPGDSEVVFAGSYQNLGLVLILEILGGYHLTLAGLGRIDVHIGDLVLAGEPVGVLPNGNAARLYMELRRNGQTVDLAPWMSAELRKANGT